MEVKRKMAKKLNRKLLLIALFMLLAVSSASKILAPAVHAVESDNQAKTLTILNDVVGINTDVYSTIKSTERDDKLLDASEKVVDLRLASVDNNFRVTCSYVKDVPALVYLSDMEGTLKMKQPVVNTVDAAKDLLSSYQRNSGDAAYGEFASMLNGVDASENVSKIAGDVQLRVSHPQKSTINYMWTYIDQNGVLAEKKNVILTYEYGTLKAFYNNWPLYTIAQTENKLSNMKAAEIAITASKDFSYPVIDENGIEQTVSVSNFSISPKSLEYAKLIYVNSVEQEFARGGDPYEMYLAWYVPLGFDKFYPGDVCGLTVILWADTGEVCGMNPMVVDSEFVSSIAEMVSGGANIDQPVSTEQSVQPSVQQQPSQQQTSEPTQFSGVSAAVGIVFALLCTCKVAGLPGNKRRPSKFRAILLCGLILSGVAVFIVPQVMATSPSGNSRIYAGPDVCNFNNNTAIAYEKTSALNICGNISEFCENNGYPGDLTSNALADKEEVLGNAYTDQYAYDGTMVFYIGHQMGNNRIQDNSGAIIEQSEVLGNTSLHKNFFVFLWVCGQAPELGVAPNSASMATAWLHRDGSPGYPYLTSDGFGVANSDPYGQCYIGFYGYSPMTSTAVSVSNGYYYVFDGIGASFPCEQFIIDFYDYALNYELAVYDALDHASWSYFGCNYLDTVLYKSYNCWLPGIQDLENYTYPGYWPKDYPGGYPNCSMRVLGDSTIKLYQPSLTVNASAGGQTVTANVYIDDEYMGTAGNGFRVRPGYHQVSINSSSHVFHNFTGYSEFEDPVGVTLTSDDTIQANYYPNPPPQYTLSISAGTGGSTTPTPGGHQYTPQYVTVTANPAVAHVLDNWILDSVNYTDNFITIPMTSNHTLAAYFADAPPYYWVKDIYDYNELVTYAENLAHWRQNDQYAYLIDYGQEEAYGEIIGVMNGTSSGHIYVYGSRDGTEEEYGDLSVYISNSTSTWTHVSDTTVYDGSPYWIDCGVYLGTFDFLKVIGEDPIDYATFELDSVRVYPPTNYTLTISAGTGGTTDPSPDAYEYPETSNVTVTASEDSGYDFDHWVLDSQPAGSNPSTVVSMDDDHELEAVFTAEQIALTVLGDAFGEYIETNVWIDSEWQGTTDDTFYVTAGYHTIEVDDMVEGWWFNDYYISGVGIEYDNPLGLTISSATTVTAEYYTGK
jgi:hypothetical protein